MVPHVPTFVFWSFLPLSSVFFFFFLPTHQACSVSLLSFFSVILSAPLPSLVYAWILGLIPSRFHFPFSHCLLHIPTWTCSPQTYKANWIFFFFKSAKAQGSASKPQEPPWLSPSLPIAHHHYHIVMELF